MAEQQRTGFNPKETADQMVKISGVHLDVFSHILPAIRNAAEDGKYSVEVSIPNKDNKFEQMSRDAIISLVRTFLLGHKFVGVSVEPESLMIINRNIIAFKSASCVSRTSSELKLTLTW
jgi:hypothetical protein